MVAWRCAALRWESLSIAIGVRYSKVPCTQASPRGRRFLPRLGCCFVPGFKMQPAGTGTPRTSRQSNAPEVTPEPQPRNASPVNKLTPDRPIFPKPRETTLGNLGYHSFSSHPNSRRIRAARWPCPTWHWQKDPTLSDEPKTSCGSWEIPDDGNRLSRMRRGAASNETCGCFFVHDEVRNGEPGSRYAW
jgi:hypothetical protein